MARLGHCGHDGATGMREWWQHHDAHHMGVLTSHASPFGENSSTTARARTLPFRTQPLRLFLDILKIESWRRI